MTPKQIIEKHLSESGLFFDSALIEKIYSSLKAKYIFSRRKKNKSVRIHRGKKITPVSGGWKIPGSETIFKSLNDARFQINLDLTDTKTNHIMTIKDPILAPYYIQVSKGRYGVYVEKVPEDKSKKTYCKKLKDCGDFGSALTAIKDLLFSNQDKTVNIKGFLDIQNIFLEEMKNTTKS